MPRDTPTEAPGRILPSATRQKPGTPWGRSGTQLRTETSAHDHSARYRGSSLCSSILSLDGDSSQEHQFCPSRRATAEPGSWQASTRQVAMDRSRAKSQQVPATATGQAQDSTLVTMDY